jgi:hypothetical protein
MPKKKTKDMMVRGVPLDVYIRYRKLKDEKGIKSKEIMERGISLFGGGDENEEINQKEKNPLDEFNIEVAEIKGHIKIFKEILDLKKKIVKLSKDLEAIGNKDVEVNMYIELKMLYDRLNQLIEKSVPKHEIPDDPEARRKMGLPERYWREEPQLISMEQAQERARRMNSPGEWDNKLNSDTSTKMDARVGETSDRLKKKIEEAEKRLNKEKGVEKAIEEEPVSGKSEVDKTALAEKMEKVLKKFEKMEKKRQKDSSKKEKSTDKKGKGISTEFFSRGFEDWDEEE